MTEFHRDQSLESPPCGATAIFWPDDEACDAECALPAGHEPADVHEDKSLGRWSEDDLLTNRRQS